MNRLFGKILGLAGAITLASVVHAAAALTVVVPYAAGSSVDLAIRLIAEQLSRRIGEPVIVDNRPGASGLIGINGFLNAPADENSLLVFSSSHVIVAAGPNAPFDPVKDLAPVFVWGRGAFFFTVSADSPVKTMADLFAYAKSRPDKINFANQGVGTQTHVTSLLFKEKSGIDFVPVAYKGSNETTVALMGGHADVSIEAFTVIKPLVEAGKLRTLAVSTAKPWPIAPDMPGMEQVGVQGMDVSFWLGLAMHVGTDPARIAALNEALNGVFNDEAFRADFVTRTTQEIVAGPPEAMADIISNDFETWSQIIRDNNITVQ